MLKKTFFDYDFVKSFLSNSAGDLAPLLIKHYFNHKGFCDEDAAKKLKTKVTEIRTTLNRLHYRGFSEYARKKNKNTGWYSYTWKINNKNILEYVMREEKEEIEKTREEIKKMQDYCFFSCKKNCAEVIFEIAAQYNFICPECGKEMAALNNNIKIKNYLKKIKDIETLIKKFDGID